MIKDVIYISITHLLYVILTGEQKIRPGILLGDVGLDSPLGLHYLNEIQIAQEYSCFKNSFSAFHDMFHINILRIQNCLENWFLNDF